METILDKKIEELVRNINTMGESTTLISVEAQEIKSLRESLKQEILKTIQASVSATKAPLAESIAKHVNEKVQEFFDRKYQSTIALNEKVQKTINTFSGFSWKIMGIFLVSGGLAGLLCFVLGIYLMPPRLDEKHKELVVYGQALSRSFKKLTSADQTILLLDIKEIQINGY